MRLLKALGALLVLGALVLLPPFLLVTTVGNPWPSSGLSLSSPLSEEALFGVLAVVVWLLWAQLMACLLTEAYAQLTGAGGVEVPFAFGAQQQLARSLIGALAVSTLALPLAGTAQADEHTPTRAGAGVALTQDQDQTRDSADSSRAAGGQEDAERTVVVQRGDNLWSLAEKHLGAGERWEQIVELNADLVDPNKPIQPGWSLTLPANQATASSSAPAPEGTYRVQEGESLAQIAREQLGDAQQWPALVEASREITQPGGERLTNPDHIETGWKVRLPEPDTAPQAKPQPQQQRPQVDKAPQSAAKPAPVTPRHKSAPKPDTPAPAPSPAPQASDTGAVQDSDVGEDSGFPVRTAGGIGSLLAAALLGGIALRRARQARRRQPGGVIPVPTGQARATETELRQVAHVDLAMALDNGLRLLAADRYYLGVEPPHLRMVRLHQHQIEFWFTDALDVGLLEPFTATDTALMWTLPTTADALASADPSAANPWPALVALGHDTEDAWILVNLEATGGLRVETTDPDLTRHLGCAIALEAASSRWTDVEVTTVGAYPEMAQILDIDQVHYVDDVDEARGLVVAFAPTAPAPSGATLVGPSSTSAWTLTAASSEQATLEPLGLELTPQLVDDHTWEQLTSVVMTAEVDPVPVHPIPEATQQPEEEPDQAQHVQVDQAYDEDEPEGVLDEELVDEPTAPEPPAAVRGHTSPAGGDLVDTAGFAQRAEELLATGHPAVRLLAPTVEVLRPSGDLQSETHRGILTRIAVYLATQPSATKQGLMEAIWTSRRVSSGTVDSRISNLRRWLGTNPTTEQPYLPLRQLQFDEQVTTDVDLLEQLLRTGATTLTTPQLSDAVALVSLGRPFEGEDPREYAFLEYDLMRISSLAADAAYELARRLYHRGEWNNAETVCALGVRHEPGNEALWRLWILAAHAAGDTDRVHQAIARMDARIRDLDPDHARSTETQGLLDALHRHDNNQLDQARAAL